MSDRLGKSVCVCVCFLILEVVIIKKGEIVEAKLHDESRLIQGVLMITNMMTTSEIKKHTHTLFPSRSLT